MTQAIDSPTSARRFPAFSRSGNQVRYRHPNLTGAKPLSKPFAVALQLREDGFNFAFQLPIVILVLTLFTTLNGLANAQLPSNYQLEADWLIDPSDFSAKAETVKQENDSLIVLTNGLVQRSISTRLGTTVRFENLMTSESIIRAVEPEGKVTLDDRQVILGGVAEQPNRAFITQEWLDEMHAAEGAWELVNVSFDKPKERFAWKRVRHHQRHAKWPPDGIAVRLDYQSRHTINGQNGDGITISVNYEMYDGLPCLSKWITVTNHTDQPINIDRFNAETLAVVEHDNRVETRGEAIQSPSRLHVETDMAFGAFTFHGSQSHAVHWVTDQAFKTQVNYLLKEPCLLKVEPTYGPDQTVAPNQTWESFRVFELVYDSDDRERQGLALRKMYRTIAPWVTENPLMLHCTSSDPTIVKQAIDQALEAGFEMVILSFGSGFNAENDSPEYLQQWKEINDYALSHGIHLGSYSLYASRQIGGGNDVVSPEGQQPTFGHCPAITSEWGQDYLRKLNQLFSETGFLVFENDGPYPGDVDTTPRPPLQKGVNDSRWVHWRIWTDFYKQLRGRGVYLNLPDYYFLSGSNKCGMGYREVNWSLPREQQPVHTRQNIYDGTWEKTPSMGWMFVPLVNYHGGGAAATIEPLAEHLDHYQRMLLSNLGLGVQACYRGTRLYDTPETKAMVQETVAWYKQHRDILESDLVHGRRADGMDIDWMLHVNPNLQTKGLLAVYNPTAEPKRRTLRVPLYYTGIRHRTLVLHKEQELGIHALDEQARITFDVTIPAYGFTYFQFESLAENRD